MSDLTLIGLGSMGSALARTLIGAGCKFTVWNRSAEKMDEFVKLGASGASSVAEAVQASNLIMVCISNYTSTRKLLETREVMPQLAGRTFVQLGSGTPDEARDSESWIRANNGDYLDVAIEPYPEQIGDADSRFLVSGSKSAYQLAEPFLQHFCDDLRYLGETVGAANAIDLAGLVYCLGQFVGFAHSVRICESEGVGLDQFAALFAESEPARDLAEIVHAGDFEMGAIHAGSSVRVWEAVIQLHQDHAKLNGINAEIPDFFSNLFNRSIDSGYGEEDVSALVKMLRRN